MRIGIASDIHEDIDNLKKAMKIFALNSCDKLACIGDIIGFVEPYYSYHSTKNAGECIRIIKENFDIAVNGNHDLFGIKRLPKFKAGYEYPTNWFELSLEQKNGFFDGMVWNYEGEVPVDLKDDEVEFLSGLSEYHIEDIGEEKLMFSHFSFPDLSGSTKFSEITSRKLKNHFSFIEENSCNYGISGHAHPEGALSASKWQVKMLDFGTHQLNNKAKWIVCPNIASGERKSGVAIIDTEQNQLDVIQIV